MDCSTSFPNAGLPETEADELAFVLGALADPVRLKIFSLIAAQGEVCSCNLEVPIGKSQPTISHHTSKLVEAGLLEGEKRGRWMWWRVVPSRIAWLRGVLTGLEIAAAGTSLK